MQQVIALIHKMHWNIKLHGNKQCLNFHAAHRGEVYVQNGREWNGIWVEVGEGTLTMATIFLTAFRVHIKAKEKRIGF